MSIDIRTTLAIRKSCQLRANKYSFMHGDNKVTLVPLAPRQVQEDQARLHQESELECELRKKEKSEIESSEERKALVSSTKGVYKAMKHSLLVRVGCDKVPSSNFTNTIAPSFSSFVQVNHTDMELHDCCPISPNLVAISFREDVNNIGADYISQVHLKQEFLNEHYNYYLPLLDHPCEASLSPHQALCYAPVIVIEDIGL